MVGLFEDNFSAALAVELFVNGNCDEKLKAS
jgi:hypothetical protein